MQFKLSPFDDTWWRLDKDSLAQLHQRVIGTPSCHDKISVRDELSKVQIVNMVAFVKKSKDHLSYLVDRNLDIDTVSAWHAYRNNNNTLYGLFNTSADISITQSEQLVTVGLFDTTKRDVVVMAVIRRLINGLVWASKMELKLTSTKPFKWTTFDSITVYRRLP